MWHNGAAHVRLAGDGDDVPMLHAHYAIQLTISLGEAVSLRTSRKTRRRFAEGWLIGIDHPHLMESEGAAVTVLLDPMSSVGRRLSAVLGKAGALALSPKDCRRAGIEFRNCLARGWSFPDVHSAIQRMVDTLTADTEPLPPIDARVRAVLQAITANPGSNRSLRHFAALVGLSESRLAHLFRRETGIAMRQYRLGLRMKGAVELISQGMSMTRSAHQAGFADSAHFCRICRRMFGNAPSMLPDFVAATK